MLIKSPVFYAIKENEGYVHGDTFFVNLRSISICYHMTELYIDGNLAM